MQHGVAIVNLAGIGGLKAVPGLSAYVAPKHGMIGPTRQAAEYAEYGIRVNAVAPGMVATPAGSSRPIQLQRYADMQSEGRQPRRRRSQAIVVLMPDAASFVPR